MKVEFHSGVTDKLAAARRFLQKAHSAGAKVVVCGERQALDRLDSALWTADAHSFLAHWRVKAAAPPSTMARTPIWLVDDPALVQPRELLLNLGPGLAPGWEQFARIVEIVSAEAEDASAARRRWREYGLRDGVELSHSPRGVAA